MNYYEAEKSTKELCVVTVDINDLTQSSHSLSCSYQSVLRGALASMYVT